MIKSRIKFSLFLLFCAFINICRANEEVLIASDFVRPTDSDCAMGLVRLFQKAKDGNYRKVTFAKGIYHVYANHAFEKFLYISNHDSGPHRIAFPLFGFEDFEIEGNGAEFIMHGLVVPVVIENCRNILIHDLFFNHYRATHSELEVVATDSIAQTVDYKISNEYPYQIRNGELIFLKEGFEHNLDNGIFWDPATHAVAYQSRQISTPAYKILPSVITTNADQSDEIYTSDPAAPNYRYRGMANSLIAEQLKPGLVRVKGYKGQLPKKGWILTAKGLNGYNRLAPGFRLLDSKAITLRSITVHHASGMGLIAEGCTDVLLDSFNVLPKKSDKRMLSTSADATHFVGCKGKIVMNNCRFEQQLDDATNVHGTYMRVEDMNAEGVGAAIGHFQQQGFRFAVPGDSIAVINPAESSTRLAYLTVKKMEIVNPRYYFLLFNESLPAVLKTGYYLENISAYPEVEITGCHIINNRARGLLLSTPKNILIENNVLSSMMAAILCPNEFTFWYESGYVSNLTVRNNTFLDNTYGNPKPSPVISILAISKNKKPIHGKVVVENNRFINYSSNILLAEFTREQIFQNNTIKYSGTYPIDVASPVVNLEGVEKATLLNNKYDSRFLEFINPGSSVQVLINQKNTKVNADK